MAWEENSRICLNMQLIAILSRIGVIPCVAGSAQIHVRLLAKVDAQAVVPMVVMHLVEALVMECVQQVVRVLWLCFKSRKNATKE